MRLYAKNLKELLIQILSFLGVSVVLVLFFFYIYLPTSTNHGEIVTVPNLEGVPYEELDQFLTERNLRYTVNEDSGYSENHPPKTVLQQTPKAYSKVKENRNIYVTLNRVSPPTVRMPCLIDGSVKNAQAVLKSYGLQLGDIKYKPALGVNSVLEQSFNGKNYDCEELGKGVLIPKGSKIDLVAANGLGRPFSTPNFVGLPLEEAEVVIIGSGLRLGAIIYQDKAELEVLSTEDTTDGIPQIEIVEYELGEVIQQKPSSGKSVNVGQAVDLWVSGTQEDYEAKLKQDSIDLAEQGAY